MLPLSICRQNKPRKVIEDDDVHYFYWPVELGVTYITVWNKKLPILPIKFSDYEPLKETMFGNKMVVATRFHYEIFVYFNMVVPDKNGRPIADFSFGSHSPLVYSDIENSGLGTIEKSWKGSEADEIDGFQYLYLMYRRYIKGLLGQERCQTKQYELDSENIPDNVRFDPKKAKALIWIGTLPDRDELRHVGFDCA